MEVFFYIHLYNIYKALFKFILQYTYTIRKDYTSSRRSISLVDFILILFKVAKQKEEQQQKVTLTL